MANYNRITESKYKAVKTLLKGGASIREVTEYLQISEPVVRGIKKSETYEEYVNVRTARELERKQIAAIKAKEKDAKTATETKSEERKETAPAQIVEHKQTITIQATHYMMQEMQKTNELLTVLSNKLAFIVDELTK